MLLFLSQLLLNHEEKLNDQYMELESRPSAISFLPEDNTVTKHDSSKDDTKPKDDQSKAIPEDDFEDDILDSEESNNFDKVLGGSDAAAGGMISARPANTFD